ncbi:lasso RiPP family leader peptide-containing protein [Thermomonas alba]|uniref:lasso RiPP family leader peptide-containing protein n=1 Tax=Thermomonas alba TaxID=2888525 RepID=UPI001F048C3C|nr:lasso RiPP family leader peptide-containing protein [Thermomonas alba]
MNRCDDRSQTRERQPYEAPALIEFGSIAELTQAGGVSQVEGATPIPNKKP